MKGENMRGVDVNNQKPKNKHTQQYKNDEKNQKLIKPKPIKITKPSITKKNMQFISTYSNGSWKFPNAVSEKQTEKEALFTVSVNLIFLYL